MSFALELLLDNLRKYDELSFNDEKGKYAGKIDYTLYSHKLVLKYFAYNQLDNVIEFKDKLLSCLSNWVIHSDSRILFHSSPVEKEKITEWNAYYFVVEVIDIKEYSDHIFPFVTI